MTTYSTPNVYIEEQSTLPKSIVTADTAVPAFVGYTEKAEDSSGQSLTDVPTRISSLHEYETYFGTAETTTFTITATIGTGSDDHSYAIDTPDLNYFMAHAVELFFRNGGGDCYILSVGTNDSTGPSASDLTSGLDILKSEDGPTLIVIPDAANLTASEHGALVDDMLAHCESMGDRFALIDVIDSADISTDASNFRTNTGTSDLKHGAAYYPYLKTNLTYQYDNVDQSVSGGLTGTLGNQSSEHYNNIVELLDEKTVTLPPSAAIAGVIATIDHNIGSWKAPANVSLSYVSEPNIKINDTDQADLNVDAESGKSINAIRNFNGKGNLVWGARTLAGNDNEWRYVPVRRLFTQIESDIKKATFFAVFEPNTSVTWQRIKAMCESYLSKIWQAGGLQGASADEAFFISCGLGDTMTEDDILNGRLNVSIGLAAARPAEFVIFTFTHYVQAS